MNKEDLVKNQLNSILVLSHLVYQEHCNMAFSSRSKKKSKGGSLVDGLSSSFDISQANQVYDSIDGIYNLINRYLANISEKSLNELYETILELENKLINETKHLAPGIPFYTISNLLFKRVKSLLSSTSMKPSYLLQVHAEIFIDVLRVYFNNLNRKIESLGVFGWLKGANSEKEKMVIIESMIKRLEKFVIFVNNEELSIEERIADYNKIIIIFNNKNNSISKKSGSLSEILRLFKT